MARSDADQLEDALAEGRAVMAGPRATSVRYDAPSHRLIVALTTGYDVGFNPALLQGLSEATAQELAEVVVTEMGLGLHHAGLDADLYIPALLEGVFGSRAWMASVLGGKGGASTSEAKRAAARANGAKGGRPRGTPVSRRRA